MNLTMFSFQGVKHMFAVVAFIYLMLAGGAIAEATVIDLVPTYSISGYVWTAADGNGVWGDESGINGRTVNLYSTSDELLYSDTTEAGEGDGYYYFEIPVGSYKVCQELEVMTEQTYPNNTDEDTRVLVASPLAATPGAPDCYSIEILDGGFASVNFGYAEIGPTYRVYGYVWNDADQDGNDVQEQEEGEEALKDWDVSITNGDDTYTTNTNEEGYYSFEVPAGVWTISDGSPSGWNQTFPTENENTHIVDVAVYVSFGVTPFDIFAMVKNLVIPTAYARALPEFGPYNFGNHQVSSKSSSGSKVTAQCSDKKDNDNNGVKDENDAGCHSDGDANNPNSYVRSDRTERAGVVLGESTTNADTQAGGNGTSSSMKFKFLIDLGIGTTISPDVVELQKRLRAEGYFNFPTNTGYFGPITQTAVREYQAAHPEIGYLTGFVGPFTRAVLNK